MYKPHPHLLVNFECSKYTAFNNTRGKYGTCCGDWAFPDLWGPVDKLSGERVLTLCGSYSMYVRGGHANTRTNNEP